MTSRNIWHYRRLDIGSTLLFDGKAYKVMHVGEKVAETAYFKNGAYYTELLEVL